MIKVKKNYQFEYIFFYKAVSKESSKKEYIRILKYFKYIYLIYINFFLFKIYKIYGKVTTNKRKLKTYKAKDKKRNLIIDK